MADSLCSKDGLVHGGIIDKVVVRDAAVRFQDAGIVPVCDFQSQTNGVVWTQDSVLKGLSKVKMPSLHTLHILDENFFLIVSILPIA